MRAASTGRSSLMMSMSQGVTTVSNDPSGNGALRCITKDQVKILVRSFRRAQFSDGLHRLRATERRDRKFVQTELLARRHGFGDQHQQRIEIHCDGQ